MKCHHVDPWGFLSKLLAAKTPCFHASPLCSCSQFLPPASIFMLDHNRQHRYKCYYYD